MPARKKAELYDIVERIVGMYHDDKLEIREIESRLRDEGYDISRGSIHRTLKDNKKVAEDYRRAVAEAQVLIETVRDNPNTDVLETTTSLLAQKFLEFAKSMDAVDFDDPAKFAESLSRIARSQAQLGKLRMDYQKGFEEAKNKVMNALADALKDKPGLLGELRLVVEALGTEA